MKDIAITVDQLVVEYKSFLNNKVRAVDGLTFDVKRGEVVGFLGPNGAGKSTTLKVLMGFQHPASGSASIFGLRAGSIQAKQKVGFLPEVALYYPFLTPAEALTLYGQLQGIEAKSLSNEIDYLLNRVGLTDKRNTLCKNLSKGMQQRVGIAQAILGNPELLILDEVASGLDPVGRRDLRTLLKEKADGGTTIFFSSHELTEVEMLCDRIILINKGKLVEEKSVSSVKNNLRKPYLRFDGAVNLKDLNAVWSEESGIITAYFDNTEQQIAAIERITGENGKILDIGIQEWSMEDYFVDTITRRAA